MMTGFALGSGIKDCLLEVSRQSDKQFAIACSLALVRIPALLDWCRTEYGITCEIPDAYFPDAPKMPVPKMPPEKAAEVSFLYP